MKGKTILIIGATSGISSTPRWPSPRKARVLVTGRDEEHGREAVGELRRRAGHDRIDFLAVDHSTVGGNRDLAERISNQLDRLDVLVNNVGGIYTRRWETEDGYEAALAVNFLGPFALTDGLLSLLLESAPAASST